MFRLIKVYDFLKKCQELFDLASDLVVVVSSFIADLGKVACEHGSSSVRVSHVKRSTVRFI